MRERVEDITKLPVWAQRRIENLNNDVEYWKRKVGEAANPDSKVRAWGGSVDDDFGLPDDFLVQFRPDENQRIDVRISSRGAYLEVRSYNGTIQVTPQASNVIHVREGDRFQ